MGINWLGQAVDNIGTALNLPVIGGGLGEKIAGNILPMTGSTPENRVYEQTLQQNLPNIPTTGYSPIKTATSNGRVLGTATSSGSQVSNPTQQITNPSGGGGGNPLQDYINTLNSQYGNMESSLSPMYDSQAQGINEQYQGGLKNIDLQAQEGYNSLNNQRSTVQTNQTNNLRDLADAIRNSYQSFSNQLGAYGAGDSSASNVMLPYALSRTEAKQRGNITGQSATLLGDINARESTLQNLVLQEKNKLDMEKSSQLSSLAQWFNQAKATLAQQKGANVIAGSQQILQNALNEMNNINNQYQAKQTALQQWAMNNSNSLAALKQNMQSVTDPSLLGTLPTYGNLPTTSGMTQTQAALPYTATSTDEKKWYQA